MIRKLLLGLSVVAFACAGAAFAQQGGIKRTPLQKAEFPDGLSASVASPRFPRAAAPGDTAIPGLNSATSWRAKPISSLTANLPSI